PKQVAEQGGVDTEFAIDHMDGHGGPLLVRVAARAHAGRGGRVRRCSRTLKRRQPAGSSGLSAAQACPAMLLARSTSPASASACTAAASSSVSGLATAVVAAAGGVSFNVAVTNRLRR